MTENEQLILTAISEKLKKVHPHAETELKQWEAAVMLPLVENEGKLSVLFQVRSRDLKWQPGDICFPGGRSEPEDVDMAVTACRELEEELGLAKDDYTLLGPLNYFYTYIGPVLFPFVGVIHHPEHIKLQSAEVEEVFTIPLETLLTLEPITGGITVAAKPDEGFPYDVLPEYKPQWQVRKRYQLVCYLYENRRIWGMTARVLADFLKKIKG